MSTGVANQNISVSSSQKFMPVLTPDYGVADEGSFYVSTLAATAATAVACTTQALADTNPSLAIYNGQTTGGMNIYLRYIKAFVTVVGGSNTSKNYSMLTDNLTVKLTTLGTALGAPQNINTGSPTLSKMSGYGGVCVAAAQTAQGRRVGAGQIVGAVEVAFDEWIFTFGDPANKNLIGTATVISARTVPCAPIILAPGWWFTLGLWGASQAASADTIGWEIGYIERPAGQ